VHNQLAGGAMIDPSANAPTHGGVSGTVFQGQNVTDHKQIMDMLTAALAFCRGMFSASRDCVEVLDGDGQIHLVCEPSERMLDCRTEDFAGKAWSTLWPEEERPLLDQAVRSAIETGHGHCTARRDLPDGTPTWWDSVITAIPLPDGRPVRLLAVSRDITRLIETQERLRESEERYRLTVELSLQLILTGDAHGAVIDISTRWTEFTGLPREAALGNGWMDAVHPDDRPHVERECAAAFASGDPLDIEYRARRYDGVFQWVRGRARPKRDEDGAIVRWYGSVENIDEARRAGDALRQAGERFRLAAQATNDAIWDWDLRTRQVHWSGTLHALFGHDEEQAATSGWWIGQIHPEDRPAIQRSIDAVIDGPIAHWSAEYRFRRPDGSYAEILDRGNVIRDEAGFAVRMVGAMQDLTNRKAAERKIRQIQNELIHVSRHSAMGAMASMLAHELNQPLTAVASYVKGGQRLILSRGADALAEIEVALEEAAVQALRAGAILRSLRAMVSTGNVVRRAENVARLVGEARSLALAGSGDIGVICNISLDPNAPFAACDRIQIQQVLLNLVRNAIEAFGDRPIKEVAISSHKRGCRFVEIRVEDNGPGVAPEIAKGLFSPFVTSKEGGMGVGLSICRTIIEAHDGRLWLERSKLGGAAFCFTLETASPPEQSGEDRQ